jgi:stress response protein YsnF
VDVEGRARIIDRSTSSGSGQHSGLHGLALSNEDRHAYGEGIRRGGYMLCAEVDGDEDSEKIVSILEQTSSVDLDERQESWRKDGWQGTSGTSGLGSAGTQSFAGTGSASTQGLGETSRSSGQSLEEEHIPIVEEQIVVGKREVSRGGARVRTYVREVPVHEEVSLREEHVSVERRPVDQKLERGVVERDAGIFQERTIEMTEMSEEAVVAKEAHVREEIVVKKTAEQRTEQIDDTVRKTEVEVDEGKTGSAFGFKDSGEQSSSQRTGFETTDRDRNS